MPARSIAKTAGRDADEASVRGRILDAAFSVFTAGGYAGTSTLEIASRAHVSKRALYELVGNKQAVLIACISERAKRLGAPADLPETRDRESLAKVLTMFGTQQLREVCDPTVIAVFRLAIAEAASAPEVAQALDSMAGETSRAALQGIMSGALSFGLVNGRPVEMAERFSGLLWSNLMLGLLLGVVERPSPREIGRRTRDATAAFLQLFPRPAD